MHPFLIVEIELMRRRFLSGFGLMVVALTTFLAGCGGGSKVPKLAPVTGTVQIKGEPASNVTVIFTPSAGTKSTGATGVTGPDGKYQLVHRSGQPGIEPGKYGVTFSRMVMPDGQPLPAGTSPTDVGAVEAIPEQFRNAANPIQTADVPEKGGTFDFGIGTPQK